jgi:hypothetical protein
MSDNVQQQMSHADSHDLDKLARWKSGLDSAANPDDASFPACAIFLVGPEDRAAHDIFRRYRSEFEELGGGFHHLVIFGQHGVSTTQVAFLDELDAGGESVPLLAIAPGSAGAEDIHCISLPQGERDGELDESQPWGGVLQAVEVAARRRAMLDLDGLPGTRRTKIRGGTLLATIDGVLQALSERA